MPLLQRISLRPERISADMGLSQIQGRVLVAGDVMEDIIVLPEGEMVRGSDVRAKIRLMPGGSGANQAVWLGAFGVPVRFLARVGSSDMSALCSSFETQGVQPVLIGDEDLPTGKLVTLVGADGERSFFTDRAANVALSVSDLPDTILDDIGLLHLSGYAFFEPGPREVAIRLMALAREAGIIISIDPASTGFLAEVGAAQFLEWTRDAQLFFPNRGEAALLSGTKDVEQGMRYLGGYYETVVAKLGADGAMARTRDGVIASADAVSIKAVDSTGAGDAFFAGFVSARINGAKLDECLECGNGAGAKAAAHMGGRPDYR